MTQRVDNPNNINVLVANPTPLVIQGDPAGVPIPVSGGAELKELGELIIAKTAVVLDNTFRTVFHVKNKCREGVNLPQIGIITKHALAQNLQVRLQLFLTEAQWQGGVANAWGYANMQAIAASGWRASYFGGITPSGLPVSASATRMEGVGWVYATVEAAWATGGPSSVDFYLVPNFELEEVTP